MANMNDNIQNTLLNASIEAGRNALKASVVINGAASVSMLTFIGTIANGDKSKIIINELALPLVCFVVGVFFYAIASGLTYIAQSRLYLYPERTSGKKINYSAIIAVTLSYLSFVVGSYNAYQVFVNWP